MSFDGIVTNAVIKELNETILGGRIDKIYQQEKDEILLNIHNKGENYRLIISASSNNPRIYLTTFSKKNPPAPPVFCMLLRKHLSGGIILNIEQFEMDRVVFIDISSIDELGFPTEKRLIIEIMGKHSNIILIDKETNKIIDSIKRVSEDMSRIRQVLPGFIYQYPPLGGKKNPLKTSREEFFTLFENENKNTNAYKFLYFNYLGLSPMIAREICFQSNIDIDRSLISIINDDKINLYVEFKNIMKLAEKGDYKPIYITANDNNDIIAFYSLDLKQYGNDNKFYFSSISSLLDNVYRKKDIMDRINQKSHSIRKSLNVKLDRAQHKLGKQKEELFDSEARDKYKVYADLISANIYKIPRGIDKIELDNFYDENMEKLVVPLDIRLSPVDNAQKYYKKYSKLKNANQLLLKQIPETEKEIEYLENVLLSLDNSTEIEELDEIKEELISEGYLKGNDKKQKKKKEEKISKPMEFVSTDNIKIYVGKNNKQNDYLTLKFSNKEDLWLHVQGMPGSHVIIKSEGRKIPDNTLEEAAILASYFSKGKSSKHIPIDYTQRKNVKKPKNAKTGMVIYDNYSTIIVDPDKKVVDRLSSEEL